MADLVQPQWYVVHTYSGYENKVKANLEKTVENNGLEDMIQRSLDPDRRRPLRSKTTSVAKRFKESCCRATCW